MAGEPQGYEFTLAPVFDPTFFVPIGAEFTIVAPTIPPPGAPTILSAQGGQIDTEGASQVSLTWDAASGTVLKYGLARIPGNMPVPSGSDWSTVTEYAGAVIVTEAIGAEDTSYMETLPGADRGAAWTYYLFAGGMGSYGASDAILIETIPGAPASFIVVDPDDGTLVLVWTAISAPNVDGVNIYRSKWGWNNDESVKLNVALVTGNIFVDGAGNANRVSEGTAEYPVDGQHWAYVYRIEAQDTTTAWTTGTSNAVAGGSEVKIAAKTET